MTPKEEAHGLIVKALVQFEKLTINESKKIALIAVEFSEEYADNSERSCYEYRNTLEYLREVKQEIEKL
jgi:hypothetical protein